MIKPDAVKAGKVDEMQKIIKAAGFKIIKQQKVNLSKEKVRYVHALLPAAPLPSMEMLCISHHVPAHPPNPSRVRPAFALRSIREIYNTSASPIFLAAQCMMIFINGASDADVCNTCLT